MVQEIELKYKVNKIPLQYNRKLLINQIYFDGLKYVEVLNKIFKNIDLDLISTFRVRKIKENNNIKYVVTIKSKGISFSRFEFEREIDEKTFKLLSSEPLSEVKKNRYIVNQYGFIFEFDEYLNLKSDLITCEVEFQNEDVLKRDKSVVEKVFKELFEIEYLDVTFDNRYKNSNLTQYF